MSYYSIYTVLLWQITIFNLFDCFSQKNVLCMKYFGHIQTDILLLQPQVTLS